MKEGRKPEYPEKPLATSFRKCHILQSPKIPAPSETRTRAVALVVGWESRHANRYTTRRQVDNVSPQTGSI